MDETPDYTDTDDTNPNTAEGSEMGDTPEARRRKSEANQLRRSIFGKKHDRLGESKVRDIVFWGSFCSLHSFCFFCVTPDPTLY